MFRHLTDRLWSFPSEENGFYKEIIAIMIIQFARTTTSQDLSIHSYSLLLFLGALVYVVTRERNPSVVKPIALAESPIFHVSS